MVLEDFWAKTKPFQSVATHGIVSGFVCRELLNAYCSESIRTCIASYFPKGWEYAVDFIAYVVSLHDIGKLDDTFQIKEPKMAEKLREAGAVSFGRRNVRHELTGKAAIRRIWQGMGADEDMTDILSAIVGAHHQRDTVLTGNSHSPYFRAFQEQMETRMREIFLQTAESVFPEVPEENEGVLETLFLGLMILSDWIASGSLFLDAQDWISQENAGEQIKERTRVFLEESGLYPRSIQWPESFPELWRWIYRDSMRPIQTAVEEITKAQQDNLLMLIEAPMGEGKTEAGMYAAVQLAKAWGKDGFYIALPTAATSNQMVNRMRDWFASQGLTDKVRLLHGMAWLTDAVAEQRFQTEAEAEIVNWLAPVRRALLGQFSVGTIDQAMLAVSKTKYGILRLLGLSNKVLIIDEIHSYDIYMGRFLVLLFTWCRALEIPVVLLSATLPPELKRRLLLPYTAKPLGANYPLITTVTKDGIVRERVVGEITRRQTVHIEMLPCLYQPERIAEFAVALVRCSGCLCILMNTVQQAQQVYREVKRIFDGDMLLFHAQFPAGRRQEIEEECVRKYGKDKTHRPEKSILVATQVVEQSLDVDFDGMLSAAAPVDLLLQRMGRIFRHSNTKRPASMQTPKQWVLIPKDGHFQADGAVYPEVLLNQTVQVLKGKETVRIPEDMAQLVADGYDSRKVPASEAEKWTEKLIADGIKAGQAQQYLINPPDRQLSAICQDIVFADSDSSFLAVKTRLGEPSVRIALLEPELFARLAETAVLRDGKRYVPVASKQLAQQILAQSVSVRKKRLCFNGADLLYLYGDKMISGLRLYPSQNGIWECAEGRIVNDCELGILIEEG